MTSNVTPIRPPGPQLTREQMERRILEVEGAVAQIRSHIAYLNSEIEKAKVEHAELYAELIIPEPGKSPLRTCFPSRTEDL